MTQDIFIIQLILGVCLFFILNWIGKHSYSLDYVSLSLFSEQSKSPAFNYIIRVFSPVVYIIIISTLFYSFTLDRYTYNIYLVSVYYILFRLIVNLLTGRGMLINWLKQIIYWISIIGFSYLIYHKFIILKKNILPDFTTIANEVWVIILIFLYQVFNKINVPQEGATKRHESYIRNHYVEFKKDYGHIINDILEEGQLRCLAYSIIIYENFNRPKAIRLIENIRFYFTKKPHTLGIMQVNTNEYINDRKSVEKGCYRILNSFQNHKHLFISNKKQYYHGDYSIISDIISDYNLGSEYHSEVYEIFTYVKSEFYKNDQEILLAFTETLIANNSTE